MSALEETLLLQIRAAGLPEPIREARFAHCYGRQWRFDFAWSFPYLIALEVQGGTFTHGGHSRGQGSEEDMVKAGVAVLLGWRVVTVNTHMVADGRALRLLRALLEGEPRAPAAMDLAREKCERCNLAARKRKERLARKLARESQGKNLS